MMDYELKKPVAPVYAGYAKRSPYQNNCASTSFKRSNYTSAPKYQTTKTKIQPVITTTTTPTFTLDLVDSDSDLNSDSVSSIENIPTRITTRSISTNTLPKCNTVVITEKSTSETIIPKTKTWPLLQHAINNKFEDVIYGPSENPDVAWANIAPKVTHRKLRKMNPNATNCPEDSFRVVCVSDTHGHDLKSIRIPDGDVLIHAGDFSEVGHFDEIVAFNEWLGTLPHKHKYVIAGNHDILLDQKNYNEIWHNFHSEKLDPTAQIQELLTNCTYLEDESVELFGYKFYGSPYQPAFGSWAFNLKRGEECRSKWNEIPSDVDVLITHTPPVGYGDKLYNGKRAGCVDLLAEVQQRVSPIYHVFGHLHEGYGLYTDGNTKYVNASMCDHKSLLSHSQDPIVFDLPKCKQ
eukprot:Pgem_evm1s1292